MKNSKLRDRRKELGLTMLEIAKSVGVSEATISRWESGDIANMRRDKIVKLANALRVTPDFIMTDKEYHQMPLSDYSPHEQQVINHYRAKPEMQAAVDKLLGIESDSLDTLKQKPFIAAASGKKYDAEPLDIDTMIEIENMGKLKK